ncbi:MAG: hypothetical protein AABZ12_15135 [Planctomycetota bacterium]
MVDRRNQPDPPDHKPGANARAADADHLVGNAPSASRWPLFIAGAGWIVGLAFLVWMALEKTGVIGR